MIIALFGGTGGTGQQIIEQALDAGHSIRALVREPSKVTMQDNKLTIIRGNVLDDIPVMQTVTGSDAVICTLGSTSNNPDDVVSRGTQQIITAMKEEGVRRLIVVSSLGVGDSKHQIPFTFKLIAKTFLRKVMADKERQESVVRESGLDWIIVRPGGLTDGPPTGSYHFGLSPSLKANRVSRADVADFLLKQLTSSTFLRQTPAIT